MAEIRSTQEIAEKWALVTPGRSQDYQRGIENPRRDWETATAAAEGAFQDGINKAIANKSFGKGVRKAGTGKWQEGALKKGVQRWGPGVAMGQSAYAAGFAPIRDGIERCKLSPRYARGDPRNLVRVAEIVKAIQEAAQ